MNYVFAKLRLSMYASKPQAKRGHPFICRDTRVDWRLGHSGRLHEDATTLDFESINPKVMQSCFFCPLNSDFYTSLAGMMKLPKLKS